MSERPSHRGGGRGGGGHRGGGHRGGGRGGARDGGERERPKKENILDLSKYMDKEITVKFNGGREGKSHAKLPPMI
jgi:U6 snRNA-associated Sm-like protein LSm7